MALVESQSGTTLQAGCIVDKNGTPWALVNSTDGLQIIIKGAVDPSSSNVTQLLYWNSGIYYQNILGQWFKRVSGAWSATTDPRLVESASGSTLASANGSIIDGAHTSWTLVSSISFGLRIARQGVLDTTTANVVLILYRKHVIYQKNNLDSWWLWNSGWVATTDPRLAESANGTSLTSNTGSIIDAALIAWTLVRSTSSGLQVACNGKVDTTTSNITLLLYWSHVVYQQNNVGGWWYWNNGWVSASDPRLPSGKTVNVNLASTTGVDVPATLFGIGSSGDMAGNSFAVTNEPAWQAAAQSLDMTLYRPNFGNSNVMGQMFAKQGAPDWSHIDTLLANLPKFFNSQTSRLLVTLGGQAPSWIDVGSSTGQAQFADLCVQIAQRFVSAGVECVWWELWNEPDGMDINTYCALFNATSSALKSYGSSRGRTYNLGGVTDSYLHPDRMQTFATTCKPDFLSYHQYATGPGDGTFQPGGLADTPSVMQRAIANYGQAARDCRNAVAGTAAANLPIFLGEWNIVYTPDSGGGNYNIDPRQVTNVGAVFAALAIWSLVTANKNVQMAALWELYADTYYGVIRTDYSIDAQGALFRRMGNFLIGQQIMVTTSGTMALNCLATVNGSNFCIMLINYDTMNYGVHLAISGLSAAAVTSYEISAANLGGLAQQISSSSLANLTVPAMSVVFISN